jgi:hypothetical protein
VSLLGRPWKLYDVDDVEKLARRALADSLRTRGAHLRPDELDDAVAFLVAEAWELSRIFDPDRGSSFSTFLYRRLRLRYVDWLRSQGRTVWKFSGRTYERQKPELVPLDDGDADRVGAALGTRAGDPSGGRSPDLARLFRAEIAKQLGTTRRWVSSRLDELRKELRSLPP